MDFNLEDFKIALGEQCVVIMGLQKRVRQLEIENEALRNPPVQLVPKEAKDETTGPGN